MVMPISNQPTNTHTQTHTKLQSCERCGLTRILTLKDGLEQRGADVSSVQQSKWNGATSSTSRSINNSSPGIGSDSTDDSINPSTSTLLHHQPFDNNGEMALTVVKPSYPSIEMNMEDYV